MKDNFSRQAETYAKYRPGYPESLYNFILKHVHNREAAWDCATGNGQTAIDIAKHFKKVFATDISQAQLNNAAVSENIIYSRQPAEATDFKENTFDLVTVSQALHWLDRDKFYTEVIRVGKPGSLFAAWMYSLPAISPEIDELIKMKHYKETLGSYWDYERKHVDNNYTTILFPFTEIKAPSFQMILYWSIDELTGYLNSWSALQKFIAVNQYNPVDKLINLILRYWNEEKMRIHFPVYLRMGKVEK